MNRDYSFEAQKYQDHHNTEECVRNKRYGDKGEEKVAEWLRSKGRRVVMSTGSQDGHHIDMFVNGTPVDVKYQSAFRLQLQNDYGNKGWLFTGAEYIIQAFYRDNTAATSNDIYIYKRTDMMKWWFRVRQNKTTRYFYNPDTQKKGRVYELTTDDINELLSQNILKKYTFQ